VRLQRLGRAGIGLALDLQGHEHAVVAVDGGRSGRFAVDRHEPGALLAGALGEELFEPGASEAIDGDRKNVTLSRPGAGQLAEGDPDLEGGVLGRRQAVATDGGGRGQRARAGAARRAP